jgi:thioredoxin-related protein
MTKLLIALFATFSITAATWKTDFSKAKDEAKQSHKMILLSFSGSDWCGPCIRLHKEIFGSEEFQKYASENLVLVNADFPRLKKNQLPKEQVKQNEALAEKYNNTGKFPYTVLLDENGKVIKQWEGLPKETPDEFVEEVSTVAK